MSPNRERWRDPPPPLCAAERGTWAHHSVVNRLPEIGERVLQENEFSSSITEQLRRLIDDIPAGPIRPVEDPLAPDAADWEGYVAPYKGADWLTPPWFFVETYFYRRIVAAVGYFQAQPGARPDPFRLQKTRGMEKAHKVAADALRHDALGDRLLAALWGNQADLSLWPEGQGDRESTPSPAAERILVDQREEIVDHLRSQASSIRRADLLLDNAGSELAADLCLTQALLDGLPEAEIHLHAKAHPTFVSDATMVDVELTLRHFADGPDEAIRVLGQSLLDNHESGRLHLQAPFFWTSPRPAWEIPDSLKRELAGSALLLSKGDANYRRLLGDRHWEPTTPIDEILNYAPAPVALLRSLKSELAAGLTRSTIERASRADPEWMTNGRWALVQSSIPQG